MEVCLAQRYSFRLIPQRGEFTWLGRMSLAMTALHGHVHGYPTCWEEKMQLYKMTDLPDDVLLSNTLLWFVCSQNLGFYRSSLRFFFSAQTVFVSKVMSLRSNLYPFLLIQWGIAARQRRLLDPHWDPNLLLVALKSCTLPKSLLSAVETSGICLGTWQKKESRQY